VNRVVPAAALAEAATELARTIAANGPVAVRAAMPNAVLLTLNSASTVTAYSLEGNQLRVSTEGGDGSLNLRQTVAVREGSWIVADVRTEDMKLFALGSSGQRIYGFRIDPYTGDLTALGGLPRALPERWTDLRLDAAGPVVGHATDGRVIRMEAAHE